MFVACWTLVHLQAFGFIVQFVMHGCIDAVNWKIYMYGPNVHWYNYKPLALQPLSMLT